MKNLTATFAKPVLAVALTNQILNEIKLLLQL